MQPAGRMSDSPARPGRSHSNRRHHRTKGTSSSLCKRVKLKRVVEPPPPPPPPLTAPRESAALAELESRLHPSASRISQRASGGSPAPEDHVICAGINQTTSSRMSEIRRFRSRRRKRKTRTSNANQDEDQEDDANECEQDPNKRSLHWQNSARRRRLTAPMSLLSVALSSLVCLSCVSINTPGPTANCQVIELGEGLTLDQNQPAGHSNSSSNRHSSAVAPNSNDQQQLEWSLQHLESIKAESKVSAVLGENVVLNCAVQFKDGQEKPFVVNWLKYPHKLPIYIWYAGYPPHVAQGYEQRVARIGQASLNLSSVRESDQGLYECKIYYLDKRPEDKANGTWIYLDVQAPPHFTQTPATISYVQAGDSLHLTCQAQSTPAPYMRWFKNKVPIDVDAGPYRLLASSGSSDPQHLIDNKQVSAQSRPNSKQHELMANVGQNSVRLDLIIDNVQAGQTTGDYVCLASNVEGSVEAHSQVVLAVPAVITTWPRNQTRLEGERVELLCQAKALPANITYKWLFNGRPIQQLKWFESRHSVKRDGTLVIHSLHRDDQGQYKCQATNGLAQRPRQVPAVAQQPKHKPHPSDSNKPTNNSQQSSGPALAPIYAEAAAHLSVEFPARVTHSPPVQYLPLGLAGQIRCHVQSAPPVEFFTWTLNNQQFDPNADPNIERLQNGSLVIKQVGKAYEGQYRCTPFNKHGSAGSSAAMEVRVQEPPSFSARPHEFYKANLDGQVKMACEGRGSPRPTVSWRKVLRVPRHSVSASSRQSDSASVADHSHDKPPERLERSPSGREGGGGGGGASQLVQAQVNDGEGKKKRAVSRKFHGASPNNRQAHLSYDEAADEPDETHHFYATTSPSGNAQERADLALSVPTTINSVDQDNGLADDDSAANQQQQQQQQQQYGVGSATEQQQAQEQQTVIVYAKLPPDRSEFKNSYLHLHNLRKEDHGHYECVIENEVATLVAPTMLYIEETTPHAPTDVRVDTKAWSAQVTWTAGYDGGFEQSFVVWYRQVDKPRHAHDETQAGPVTTSGQQQHHQSDLIDINWHSQPVPSGGSSATVVVQNLSQDTAYEFYVRAKNIIGEGPRSQVVQATTKRAISGLVTPISQPDYGGVAASTVAGLEGDELQMPTQRPVGYEPTEDEIEPATVSPPTPSTSIRPYLIIHPEYVSNLDSSVNSLPARSKSSSEPADKQAHTTNSLAGLSVVDPLGSASNRPSQQQASSDNMELQHNQSSSLEASSTGSSNSNKVIKVHYPLGQSGNGGRQQQQGQEASAAVVGKRTSIDQSVSNESRANNSLPQADNSAAPHNVTMIKVAQGWVLSWQPPQRLPKPSDLLLNVGAERAEAIKQQLGGQIATQQQQQSDEQMLSPSETSASQVLMDSSKQQQQMGIAAPGPGEEPFAYSVELKEKNSKVWQTLATSREQSLLLKDLRPGGDYQFRVIAHTAGGLKGAPSSVFHFSIPDNRRKPGITQAFSATVTSGLLFFIACIVIAVCGVNMCNKRKKKRAEKAAYVMMACPVLESHQDIAALNSNSLLKNAPAYAAQGRISSVTGHQTHHSTESWHGHANGHRAHDLRLARGSKNFTSVANSKDRAPPTMTCLKSLGHEAFKRLRMLTRAELQGSATSNIRQHSASEHDESTRCEINFGTSESLPVDVDPPPSAVSSEQVSSRPHNHDLSETLEPKETVAPPTAQFGGDSHGSTSGSAVMPAATGQQRPLDDYWIRQPSDRKWGTLTLAASKLAERRAAAAKLKKMNAASQAVASQVALEQNAGAVTLPRSFPSQPAPLLSRRITSPSTSQASPSVLPRVAQHQQQSSEVAPPPLLPPKDMVYSAQHHRHTIHGRSISQIDPKSLASMASVRQTSLLVNNQLLAIAQRWPPTATFATQQDLRYCASMGFGPPANSFQLHSNDPNAWPQYNPFSQCAWFANWPGRQAQVATHDSTMNNPQTFPSNLSSNSAQESQHPANSSLLQRNSLARSTLPMVAPTSASLNQSILAPPYRMAHDQRQQALVVCPFYPPPMSPPQSLPRFMSQHHWEPVDVASATSNLHTFNDADDPLTENACLGSYKRKRRRPHIEAQFTMTKEPDQDQAPHLPPKDDPARSSYRGLERPRHQRPVSTHQGLMNSQPVQQPDNSQQQSLGAPEHNSGGLFVRDAHQDTVCQVVSPKPRGMPQAGQRTEQRLLKETSSQLSALQVEAINPREKIELYLRHHQIQEPAATLSSASSSASDVSPIQLDQVDSLTFQPYYNLPSLKYSINLPLLHAQDGQFLIEGSTHLKPIRRGSNSTRKSRCCGSQTSQVPTARSACESSSGQTGESKQLDQRQAAGVFSSRPLAAPDYQPDSLELILSPPPLDDDGASEMYTSVCEYQDVPADPRKEPPPVPPHRGGQLLSSQHPKTQPASSNVTNRTETSTISPADSSDGSAHLSSSAGSSSGPLTLSGGVAQQSSRLGARVAPKELVGSSPLNHQHDHSVDENYEFDQVSSCSSSMVRGTKTAIKQQRRRRRKRQSVALVMEKSHHLRVSASADEHEHEHKGPPDLELKNKGASRAPANNPSANVYVRRGRSSVSLLIERARFYDCTRQMEKPLTRSEIRPNLTKRDSLPTTNNTQRHPAELHEVSASNRATMNDATS